MQFQPIGFGIKGFYYWAKYLQRYLSMLSTKAQHKLNVLKFWGSHGLLPTVDAFGMSRRTLFLWKHQLKTGSGLPISLEERSKRPRSVRRSQWPDTIITEIKRLRKAHPNLGKEKLFVFLKCFCDQQQWRCPSARTIGRIIARDPHNRRFAPVRLNSKGRVKAYKKAPKLRKSAGFKAEYPGHCVALDTIVRHINGSRRYIITFTDLYSRYAFAWSTTSHASRAAQRFFTLVQRVFPYRFDHVLTDNGSEFQKEFSKALEDQQCAHWHTYPRTPKMNAHCERFNRTLQEEFVDYHVDDLIDTHAFNEGLVDYGVWFNAVRPHWALSLKSPLEFLMLNNQLKCNMWWANTIDRARFIL